MIRILPEAREELVETAAWYEQQRRGLGLEFLLDADASLQAIHRFPEAWPPWIPGHPFRRKSLQRFPYLVFFELLPSRAIRVVAVAHARRAPGYWRSRSS